MMHRAFVVSGVSVLAASTGGAWTFAIEDEPQESRESFADACLLAVEK